MAMKLPEALADFTAEIKARHARGATLDIVKFVALVLCDETAGALPRFHFGDARRHILARAVRTRPGGGHDGMQGLLAITTAGGLSLVQKPSEAEDVSMPEYAIAHDHVRAALSLEEIGDALVLLARGDAVPVKPPPPG